MSITIAFEFDWLAESI